MHKINFTIKVMMRAFKTSFANEQMNFKSSFSFGFKSCILAIVSPPHQNVLKRR
ncbi:hypothetical protein SAMN02745134_00815 [Clostridium acidisoli DSM 12555]|uniref:Uncharacterized protein n=1 Tax=Clostridium acidisoli DSM 12555 TaxID=1121291 RepID=A0A1W1X791_9CLOT|nr:hypothetical protein SAMN02745134_00815 [Clostridium acidisoli DSM 12555]